MEIMNKRYEESYNNIFRLFEWQRGCEDIWLLRRLGCWLREVYTWIRPGNIIGCVWKITMAPQEAHNCKGHANLINRFA